MPLQPGGRIGPYEIVVPIGAGGMGEVYRARDPRLGRDVAIKIVPAGFASDAERLQRFEQEARAAAALNHPNILAVFDIGHDSDAPYIVSELLEGETLREHLHAALPLRKAVEYTAQIARGLAAAHAKGIAHRDLKPENVFITSDGRVKLLDFGLAKLTQAEPAAAGLTALPTTPPNTLPGVVLGTVGYMAPEQARGVAADHRADIFALGAILYEMLSGRRAFSGETPMDTMTAILKEHPPDMPVGERGLPPALTRIVDRCLEKSPDARFQSAGDLAFALESLSSQSTAVDAPVSASQRRAPTLTGERLAWAAATVVAALAGYGVFFFTRPQFKPAAAVRFEIAPPSGTTFPPGLAQPYPALSPDGRRVVFIVTKGPSGLQLAVRSLDAEAAQLLPGTDVPASFLGTLFPFWSADSRFVGFFAQGKLKKIDVTGGPPQVLCDAPEGGPGGAAWNREGIVLFAGSPGGPGQGSDLLRVPASGGTPTPVVTRDAAKGERFHGWPSFLPDGRHFLFVTQTGTTAAPVNTLFVGSLDSANRTKVLTSASRTVYADGHLLFVRDGTLLAQPFDANRLSTSGDAFPVAEDVGSQPLFARAAFSVSETGLLVYRASTTALARQLAWFDRSANLLSRLGEPANVTDVEISQDGKRVAAVLRASAGTAPDIWIYDVERGVSTRLTTDGGSQPVWSPDGSRIAFQANRNGQMEILQRASGGGGEAQLLYSGKPNNVYPLSWSSDGKFLLYENGRGATPTGNDLWVLPLSGESRPRPVVQERFDETLGRFSSDGRWIAYVSTESSRSEVYVAPFPGPGDKVRISPGGGSEPRWRRDGKELFYLAPDDTLMAAAVSSQGPRFEVSGTKAVFPGRVALTANLRSGRRYDVSADGQRFLLTVPIDQAASPLRVVINWTAGVKK